MHVANAQNNRNYLSRPAQKFIASLFDLDSWNARTAGLPLSSPFLPLLVSLSHSLSPGERAKANTTSEGSAEGGDGGRGKER